MSSGTAQGPEIAPILVLTIAFVSDDQRQFVVALREFVDLFQQMREDDRVRGIVVRAIPMLKTSKVDTPDNDLDVVIGDGLESVGIHADTSPRLTVQRGPSPLTLEYVIAMQLRPFTGLTRDQAAVGVGIQGRPARAWWMASMGRVPWFRALIR